MRSINKKATNFIEIGNIKSKLVKSSTFEDEDVLTTEEAAEYLRISIGSLRNMTSNGLVIFYKLGGRNRYLKKDLKDLLLSNRRGGICGN